MARVLPNPVWINKNSVNPHNYNATKHSSQDSKRAYAQNARSAGKTIGDLLAECLEHRRWLEVIRAR